MGQINPQAAPAVFPWAAPSFGDWLFSSLIQKPEGGWDLAGLPKYPGQLSPDISQTLFPSLWNAWNPNPMSMPGGDFIGSYLNNWMMSPEMGGKLSSVFDWGGPGGRATDLINNMASWGGTGGPGNQAMSLAMQYGAPSQAGRGIADIAQRGGTGSWGDLLTATAQGRGPSFDYLSPFLNAPAYRAPGR